MIDTEQCAREYAAQLHLDLAASAFDPGFGWADHVTDSEKREYVFQQEKLANEILDGLHDGNFTVWQRMHYFKTFVIREK